jgi:hypothetical protein
MMTKNNPSQSASQGQDLRLPASNLRRALSSFSLHTSAFTLQRSSFRLLRTAFCLLLTAYCLLPTFLNAQGCAMCYNSASAAKAGAKEALANGVLILLVPPMVFFALITVVVYMHRNKFREMSVVSGRELPMVDCRLPIGGIDDCRLAIEGIENCQSAIGNHKSAMGN